MRHVAHDTVGHDMPERIAQGLGVVDREHEHVVAVAAVPHDILEVLDYKAAVVEFSQVVVLGEVIELGHQTLALHAFTNIGIDGEGTDEEDCSTSPHNSHQSEKKDYLCKNK